VALQSGLLTSGPFLVVSRLCAQVADTQQLESTMEKEDRRRLKELSDTRAAGWPNTLQVGLCEELAGHLGGLLGRLSSVEGLGHGTMQSCVQREGASTRPLRVQARRLTPNVRFASQAQRARKERARQERANAEESERQEVSKGPLT
jgi:hypothetical protein